VCRAVRMSLYTLLSIGVRECPYTALCICSCRNDLTDISRQAHSISSAHCSLRTPLRSSLQTFLSIGLYNSVYTLFAFHILLNSSPYIGGLEQRKKPQPTFCVSAKLWVHSDIQIRAPISWTQRMLKSLSLGVIWNFSI
jgi:hypothetical protein